MTTSSFFGMSKDKALDIVGLAKCCQRYGTVSDNVILTEDVDEFNAWHLQVKFGSDTLKMLCCPEDLYCKNIIINESHSRQECCEACEMPCCNECAHHIFAEEPAMPPAALANDMMIYSAPLELYTENITVMEMLCASVCITSMLCFTLDDISRTSCHG